MCLRKQEENLKEYLDGFAACADTDFKALQPNLLQSFLDMVAGMKIKVPDCHHSCVKRHQAWQGLLMVTPSAEYRAAAGEHLQQGGELSPF